MENKPEESVQFSVLSANIALPNCVEMGRRFDMQF